LPKSRLPTRWVIDANWTDQVENGEAQPDKKAECRLPISQSMGRDLSSLRSTKTLSFTAAFVSGIPRRRRPVLPQVRTFENVRPAGLITKFPVNNPV
jgi:hypothetical protein